MSNGRTAALGALTLALLAGCGSEFAAQVPMDGPGPDASGTVGPPPQAADGFRLVGYGDLAVEVPTTWGTNEAHCGTPTKDTVEIDIGGVRDCLVPRPAGVDSVHVLRTSAGFVEPGTEETTVAGRAARRSTVTCETQRKIETCTAVVQFPAEGVMFRATSSTARSEVDAILSRIRAVPGAVGVPGFRDGPHRIEHSTTEPSPYFDELEAAGLQAEVREERLPGLPAGYVLAADPTPGTVARPDDTVKVTVVPAPGGLGDTVAALTLSVSGPDDEDLPGLTHEQISAGETLDVPVGATLRIYGKTPDVTFGADLDGTFVVPSTGLHDRVAYFRAARPGTTRMTVTVANKTERDEIGTVTVVVS